MACTMASTSAASNASLRSSMEVAPSDRPPCAVKSTTGTFGNRERDVIQRISSRSSSRAIRRSTSTRSGGASIALTRAIASAASSAATTEMPCSASKPKSCVRTLRSLPTRTTLGILPFLRFGRHGDAGTVENGVGWRTALHQFQEVLGERGPARLVLVLEIHEHLAGERPDEVCPFRQRSGIVVEAPQTQVTEARCLHRGRRQVLALRDAERRARIAQRRVRLVREPARMTELERRAQISRELVEEIAQERQVRFEVRRELIQHRRQAAAEGAGRIRERLQQIRAVAPPLLVRYPLPRLEREAEPLRHLRRPPLEDLRRGPPVEGVVDLDAV